MLEIKTGRATSDTKGLEFWFGGSRKSTLGLDPLIYSQWACGRKVLLSEELAKIAEVKNLF